MTTFNTHPIIKNTLSQLYFVEACYEGNRAWFEESVPLTHQKEKSSYLKINQQSCHLNLYLANLFLPIEDSEMDVNKNDAYLMRLKRARWKPLFKSTINNFKGLLSRYQLEKDLQSIDPDYLNNVDLEGRNHYAFFQECDKLFLRDGWCAVWCDYWESSRPFLKIIERQQIIDYKIEKNTLIELTIQEGFYDGHDFKERVKVISPGLVIEYIKEDDDFKQVGEYPYDLDYIPVIFYPINTINPFSSDLPLLEIAEDNRTHYQIGSDYRESLHYKSLPLFVRIGLIQNGGDATGLTPLQLSPHSVADVPLDCDIKVIETTGQAIALNKEELQRIESDIMQKTLNYMGTDATMTATEANLRAGQYKASYEGWVNMKISAIQEIFAIWFDWENNTLSDNVIVMDTAVLEGVSVDLIRELRELVTLNYLDLETFWLVLNSAGFLPKSINVMDIIENVREANRIEGETFETR